MATVSKEELLKRIIALAQRQGLNRQQGGTRGRRTRNILNFDNLDQRQLGMPDSMGLRRPNPEAEVVEVKERKTRNALNLDTFDQRQLGVTDSLGLRRSDPEAEVVPEAEVIEESSEPINTDLSGEGPQSPEAPNVSNIGKALGHGQSMPEGIKNMLSKGALNTVAQLALTKGNIVASPISPISMGLGIARAGWSGIKNDSMRQDVTKSLRKMGFNPESEDAFDMTEYAKEMSDLRQDTLDDPDKLTTMNIETMSRTPEEVDAIENAMAANKEKSSWGHIKNWWSLGMRKPGENAGINEDNFLSSEDIQPGWSGVADPGGGPVDMKLSEAPKQFGPQNKPGTGYQDQLIGEGAGSEEQSDGGFDPDSIDADIDAAAGDWGDWGGEGDGTGGEDVGGCIIATACAGRYSPETNLLREYRDNFLNNRMLGGYYALCHKLAPWLSDHKKAAGFVKKLVVDRWADIAQVRLGYKSKPKFKTSKIIGDGFLKLFEFAGKFVDCQKWIDRHK